MDSINIGFIGAGNMANSLIRGLLARGMDSTSIRAADIDNDKLQQLTADCKITAASNQQIADCADVIVLAVKPQVIEGVCTGLHLPEAEQGPLIVSVAAGITLGHLQSWLGKQHAMVRCMPNTPALIGKGVSGLFGNANITERQRQLATQLMDSVGISVWVDSESDIDAVTAVSGSGPAYFFLFMEALQDAARELGLSKEIAKTLVYQTATGAAELAIRSEDDICELRQKVTSPGGTTEQALNQFEEDGLRETVKRALASARARSIELAKEFGNN